MEGMPPFSISARIPPLVFVEDLPEVDFYNATCLVDLMHGVLEPGELLTVLRGLTHQCMTESCRSGIEKRLQSGLITDTMSAFIDVCVCFLQENSIFQK